MLAELDKENLTARAARGAAPTCRPPRAALEAAEAQAQKNEVEAEGAGRRSSRAAPTTARKSLFAQKLIAQSALDDAHSLVDMAENRKRAAQSQLAVSQAKVAEARAQVAQAKAAVERADEELANATIKAPIRATVLTRDVEIGSPVSSILNLGANATLVMTLGDIEQVFVRGKVDEADIGRVRLGQPARITRRDLPGQDRSTAASRRSRRSASRRTTSPPSRCEVSIDNPGKELKANMTANAEIVLEEHPDSLHRARGRRHLRRAEATRPSTWSTPGSKTGRGEGAGEGRRRQRHQDPDPRRPQAGDKVVLPGVSLARGSGLAAELTDRSR